MILRRSVVLVVAVVVGTAFPETHQSTNSVQAAVASACTIDGANCAIGSVGPGGGIVFYDAGSMQWWGRYLEAKTNSVSAAGVWDLDGGESILNNKLIGMGKANSLALQRSEHSVVRRLEKSYFGADFFLPSKNELDALYNYWKTSGDSRLEYAAAPMWTSSSASTNFAWYQLFQDGTQFTDANGIIRGSVGNKNYLKSPVHVGSDFKPTEFQVIGVRAFPITSAVLAPDQTIRVTTTNQSCSAGKANTVCKIGDIGPGGGIVFYDAGSDQYWGRYFEIAPKSCEGVRLPWRPVGNKKVVYAGSSGQSAAVLRVLAKGVGMGKVNTRVVTLALGAGSYAAKFAEDSTCNGVDDWFLPSKDELDIAFNNLAQNRIAGNDTPVGGFNKGFYWTSTDYNNATAWTQYFMDGQQFDRVQTMDGNKNPPNPFRVRAIRAFGSNNVVVACKDGGACKLGDIGPGGGTVFYVADDFFMVNGTKNRYLEFASKNTVTFDETDSKSGIEFCPPNSRSNVNLGTKPYIGAGLRNTALLKSQCVGYKTEIFAGGGGKSDWFIPSIDELDALMKFMKFNYNFIFDEIGSVWSSTEIGLDRAWSMAYINRYKSMRNYSHGIRLIRAFG